MMKLDLTPFWSCKLSIAWPGVLGMLGFVR
jgi:hypothetical protein